MVEVEVFNLSVAEGVGFETIKGEGQAEEVRADCLSSSSDKIDANYGIRLSTYLMSLVRD